MFDDHSRVGKKDCNVFDLMIRANSLFCVENGCVSVYFLNGEVRVIRSACRRVIQSFSVVGDDGSRKLGNGLSAESRSCLDKNAVRSVPKSGSDGECGVLNIKVAAVNDNVRALVERTGRAVLCIARARVVGVLPVNERIRNGRNRSSNGYSASSGDDV